MPADQDTNEFNNFNNSIHYGAMHSSNYTKKSMGNLKISK